MKRSATFIKLKSHLYKLDAISDDSLFTLFMFLGDGLYRESYYKFLKDPNEQDFYGNISGMRKYSNMVTIFLYDDLIPEALMFTTTIENVVRMLQKWDALRLSQVNTINLVLDNDVLEMSGN